MSSVAALTTMRWESFGTTALYTDEAFSGIAVFPDEVAGRYIEGQAGLPTGGAAWAICQRRAQSDNQFMGGF